MKTMDLLSMLEQLKQSEPPNANLPPPAGAVLDDGEEESELEWLIRTR